MDDPPIVTSSPFSLGVSGTTNNKQWRDFEDLQLPRPRKSQPTTSLNFQLAEMPFILTQDVQKKVTKIYTKKIIPREEGPNQNNPKIPLPK